MTQRMKIGLILLLGAIAFQESSAQYYYKDVLSIQQTNATYALLKKNNIKKVTLASFDGNKPATDITIRQDVHPAQDKVVTYTKTTANGESFFTAFYNNQNQLIKTTDSSFESYNETSYQYNAQGYLTEINNKSRGDQNSSSEKHLWQYDDKGLPVSMLRIRNNTDTTYIQFVKDEKGNIAEERARHKNITQPTVFYYYDTQNRLTDIVRYNIKAKRMLPDYMFEYEEGNQPSVTTIVPEGSSDYQKWYYKYEEDGLKAAEFCYNKKGELLGKVEYAYE